MPSNPTLGITDIKAVVQLAKENGCLTFLDNTFMTPALQRPLDLGVDIVLHSATKFLSGHSDVLSGAGQASNPARQGRRRTRFAAYIAAFQALHP